MPLKEKKLIDVEAKEATEVEIEMLWVYFVKERRLWYHGKHIK